MAQSHPASGKRGASVAALFRRLLRPQDLVWLLLFSALALVSPRQSPAEIEMLSALALLQVLEPRIPFLNTPRGNLVSISLKLLLGYLLIGVTRGIFSSYYVILLLPVVSAGTTLGAAGTLAVTLIACTSYLSFLLFVPQFEYEIPPSELREVILRMTFLPVVGYLTYRLSEANRVEAKRYQAAARQLEKANADLRTAEEAVRRSDRLAALGQLTAGLAHELRNPLGTIRASAEMLAKSLPNDEVSRELAGFIATEVDRTNSLVTRFLQFARPLSPQLKLHDIHEIIDSALEQVKRQGNAMPVVLYKNYSPEVPPAPVDRELMERVVFNLVLNACQASPAASAVTVKTRLVDHGVDIAVIDRGSGIDAKHLESIFNPFFTTKPDGVGLGLAIVAKIIDEHGGKVTVESEPGKGSIFHIFLPLQPK
ncbi:MAG: ATP-binding protein [Bryobacteraceae bacterium]|nr:ATP-binding protein [Bryobacteraceae bacterium]